MRSQLLAPLVLLSTLAALSTVPAPVLAADQTSQANPPSPDGSGDDECHRKKNEEVTS